MKLTKILVIHPKLNLFCILPFSSLFVQTGNEHLHKISDKLSVLLDVYSIQITELIHPKFLRLFSEEKYELYMCIYL
jgi:hypothetical protein